MREKTLYFYCLEYGDSSTLLGVTQDWVKDLQSRGMNVVVITTHVKGSVSVKPSKLVETGGGSFRTRMRACFRLMQTLTAIVRTKDAVVFYHMHHYALAFQGLALSAMGTHQTLWYSHAQRDPLLRFANLFADLILTTSSNAYPLKNRKIISVGQAVSRQRFIEHQVMPSKPSIHQDTILTLGRVSRAKKIEKLLHSIEKSHSTRRIYLDIVGPISDFNYMKEIEEAGNDLGISLSFHKEIFYSEISNLFSKYRFYFTGTDKAIDKSAAEAAMRGLIIITDNKDLLMRLGLEEYYKNKRVNYSELGLQINHLLSLTTDQIAIISKFVSRNASNKLSIENAVELYLRALTCEKSDFSSKLGLIEKGD
jgi:hypothetical protein